MRLHQNCCCQVAASRCSCNLTKESFPQMAATLTGGDNNSMVLPVTRIIVAYEYILTSTDCIRMLCSTVSLNCYYAKNQFHNMTSTRQANASKAPSSQTKSPQRVRAQRAANPAGLGRSGHKTSGDGRGDLCCVSHAHGTEFPS